MLLCFLLATKVVFKKIDDSFIRFSIKSFGIIFLIYIFHDLRRLFCFSSRLRFKKILGNQADKCYAEKIQKK